MASHSESRVVPYTADLMYAIVADVERYPAFLPWCAGLRVLSRNARGDGEVLYAEMLVSFGGLRERYASTVTLDPASRTIDIVNRDGPFCRLESHWRFAAEGGGCRVDFSVVFEFKSMILNAVAGVAFEHALHRMTDAFEARAKALSK